jgi:hypothetical protein
MSNSREVDIKEAQKLFNVDSYTSTEEIRRIYKTLALKFHPDKNKASDANEKFQLINNAYEILIKSSNDELTKKRKYESDFYSKHAHLFNKPKTTFRWSTHCAPTEYGDYFIEHDHNFTTGFNMSFIKVYHRSTSSVTPITIFYNLNTEKPLVKYWSREDNKPVVFELPKENESLDLLLDNIFEHCLPEKLLSFIKSRF